MLSYLIPCIPYTSILASLTILDPKAPDIGTWIYPSKQSLCLGVGFSVLGPRSTQTQPRLSVALPHMCFSQDRILCSAHIRGDTWFPKGALASPGRLSKSQSLSEGRQ